MVFTKGSLCLKVTGALTIPLGKKEAVEQLFYFCGKKNCLLQKPVWCNVQYPTCIEACKTIVEQDRRKVAEEFELRIVDKCESDLIKLNSNGVTKQFCEKQLLKYVQLKMDVLQKFALGYNFSISVI